MEVSHSLGLSIKKGTSEDAGFLLTNRKGSYCSFFSVPSSRYHGLFYFDCKSSRMYKFIENIEMRNHEVTSLKNCLYFFERERGDVTESFIMPSGFNSLVYELEANSEIDLILDCKDSYDNREWGRYYEILEERGCVVVKFTKKTDGREDSSNGTVEFELYLAIKSDGNSCNKHGRWIERHYSGDEARDSKPFKRYVYDALGLNGAKFVFSMSKDKDEAIRECGHVFKNLQAIKEKEKNHFLAMMSREPLKSVLKSRKLNDEVKIAYASALYSLDSLVINNGGCLGVFAGLPWFFQFWARDTFVSLGTVSRLNNGLAQKILSKHLENIQNDGRLPNKGEISQCAADGHGWLFLRSKELLENMEEKNEHYHKFFYEIEASLEKSIVSLVKSRTKGSFEVNSPKETWMDTDFGEDNRQGARIEIQALRLGMYKLMFELALNPKYKALENILSAKVREKFWNGKILADGLDDFTVRPNIFVAAYAYPELLANAEWESCFENALKALWLEWGGLSTIDKSHPLFTISNTGESSRSYHRGDSWFWINNLAALVMHRISKKKFKKNIQKIMSASAEDILWKGCIGCHSELSSAKQLEANGCWSQAWSNAMFIEMVDEVLG